MTINVNKLRKMLQLETAASSNLSNLSDYERAVYAEALSRMEMGAGVRKITPHAKAKVQVRRTFNRSVKKHFNAGRTLSAAHKKAISEGLKRWHAAHGRGTYTGRERRHAINHINKHLAAKVAYHTEMHQKHRAKVRGSDNAEFHKTRAKNHLLAAKHFQKAILPLTSKKS